MTYNVRKIDLEDGRYRLDVGFSIKDRTKPYPIVMPYDPAIDLEKSNMDAYAGIDGDGDRDLRHLVFKNGSKPTLYWCEALRTSMATEIRSKLAMNPFAGIMFINYGLKRADDFLDVNGKLWPTWEPREKIEINNDVIIMVGKDLDLFPSADILEIVDFVERRSFLHPKKEPRFQLLPISRQLLDS